MVNCTVVHHINEANISKSIKAVVDCKASNIDIAAQKEKLVNALDMY